MIPVAVIIRMTDYQAVVPVIYGTTDVQMLNPECFISSIHVASAV